jgi:hypothetical protein
MVGCGTASQRVPCVEQIRYCKPTREDDLTGTRVRASGRLAVYSGHPCSFVPFDRFACDHLEEAAPPLETWGRSVVVAVTAPLKNEPNVVRIVSSRDDNRITFVPEVHAEVTLDAGEMMEFQATRDFRVDGQKPLSVAQFLVGQGFDGLQQAHDSVRDQENGDPSFTLVAPVEQFRTSYDFLAPNTYEQSWVLVTAPVGRAVVLDGLPVTGFTTVEGTELQTARVRIDSGVHEMRGDAPFGLQLYGFGAFTSYMAPAGLNLDPINPI